MSRQSYLATETDTEPRRQEGDDVFVWIVFVSLLALVSILLLDILQWIAIEPIHYRIAIIFAAFATLVWILRRPTPGGGVKLAAVLVIGLIAIDPASIVETIGLGTSNETALLEPVEQAPTSIGLTPTSGGLRYDKSRAADVVFEKGRYRPPLVATPPGSTGAIAFYDLHIDQPAILSIYSDDPQKVMRSYLVLSRPQEQGYPPRIIDRTSSPASDTQARITRLVQPGDYVIELGLVSSPSPGGIALTVTDWTPGGGLATSTEIKLGGAALPGNVEIAGTQNWYLLDLRNERIPSGKCVAVEVKSELSDTDTWAFVYDVVEGKNPDGTNGPRMRSEIASNNDVDDQHLWSLAVFRPGDPPGGDGRYLIRTRVSAARTGSYAVRAYLVGTDRENNCVAGKVN